jgi:hypothetical protein
MTEHEKIRVRDAELVMNRLLPKFPGGAEYKAEVADEDGHPTLTIADMTFTRERHLISWDVTVEVPTRGHRDDPPTTEERIIVQGAFSFQEALIQAVAGYYREAAENMLSDQSMADDVATNAKSAIDFANDMARAWEPLQDGE